MWSICASWTEPDALDPAIPLSCIMLLCELGILAALGVESREAPTHGVVT